VRCSSCVPSAAAACTELPRSEACSAPVFPTAAVPLRAVAGTRIAGMAIACVARSAPCRAATRKPRRQEQTRACCLACVPV
jgi:hypothetical protein